MTTPEKPPEQAMAHAVAEADAATPVIAWPEPLGSAAYHGILGEIVRAIEPHTEAAPVGVLLSLLAASGSSIGRGPHLMIDGSRHAANLFVLLVGATGAGRKGTAHSLAMGVMREADTEWATRAVSSGLSSGEGLINHVRDASGEDPGATEKRLLVAEGEFAAVLRVIRRDGNTLSAILRSAWDGSTLSVLTRRDPLRASGAHVSIAGHITPDELRQLITRADIANGLGNRFLIAMVRRSQSLPMGGVPPEHVMQRLTAELRARLDAARKRGEVHLTASAREWYASNYVRRAESVSGGLVGELLARATSHIPRVALLYALLDGETTIRPEHLEAAHALHEYCAASVQYLFGAELGNPLADMLRDLLREAGDWISRATIREAVGNHVKAQEIAAALRQLADAGLAESQQGPPTGGRRPELWRLRRREESKVRDHTPSGGDIAPLPSFPPASEVKGRVLHKYGEAA